MERRRFLAIVMTVMMVISLIPSMVFAAAPSGELGGKLKIKGLAAVGVVLSADYAKVTPEEVTDEDFTFSWSRQTGEKELTQVGTEKTYTITQDDLTKVSRQLDVSMGDMMGMMYGFSVTIFLVVIYLLSKVIIEKNAQSISMTKILGYTNGEISRLYILSTSLVVVFCLLLSLPVERQIMEVLFREMMLSSISGWITMWVDPMIYVKMTAIGIAAYGVVAVLEFRRIRHVPMDEALKNVE